jgi:lipopolysaccharide transport system ATP-binding protein
MSIAIKIENLSKQYRLGLIGTGTLSHDLRRWWYLVRGKEDPYLKIGEVNNRSIVGDSDYIWALKDINLEVQQGEVLGIIGKNGAGKSTLLKILSKVTAPTTGKITYNGRIGSLLEVGTGFHPELTGRENIYLNGAILGMRKREINRKFDEIVDFSGCVRYIDTPVKRYSSGMTVRLGFAIAAFLEPEILVVDEVLAVGDAEFQKKAIGKMQDVSRNEGRTVLFVSHNMGAIQQLCNKLLYINQGKIEYYGDEIKENIRYYLSEQISHSSNIEEFRFEDEIFKFINAKIIDKSNNELKSPIPNNIKFYLGIEFELKKQDIAFNLGYAIYNSDGILFYWSITTDVEEQDWPKFNIGYNKIKGEIPRNLLNEDDYKIGLIVSLHMQQWIINPDKNSPYICFTVKGSLSNSPYWYQRRPGLLAPIIKWELLK